MFGITYEGLALVLGSYMCIHIGFTVLRIIAIIGEELGVKE